jgi:DNA-binding FadR family transcriptional regulator
MPAETFRRPQFDVQQEIKNLILRDGLGHGSSLPAETELMATLGVGRCSIREALKGLEARGMVTVEHGRGTFVGRPTLDPLVDTLIFHRRIASQSRELDTTADLVDIREILETRLVQRVSLIADDELISVLERTVGEMESSAKSGRPFQTHDRAFHEQLYAPLGNHLVIQLVAAFWDVLDAVRPRLRDVTSDLVADAAIHRRILERVRDRDSEGAALAMQAHFRDTHLWIDGSTAG